MNRLKEVVVIANNKGGVGKTTTVQNIAAGLMEINPNNKILLIDLDAQCNLSYLMEYEHTGFTIVDALKLNGATNGSLPVYMNSRGLYYVPGSVEMKNVDLILSQHFDRNRVLFGCFRKPLMIYDGSVGDIISDFDYVIIDCPPSLGDITRNALMVGSKIIIPIQLEALSVQGLTGMIKEFKEAVDNGANPNLQDAHILRVKVRKNLTTARGYNSFLNKEGNEYSKYLVNATVRLSDDINKSQILSKDIFKYNKYSPVSLDYMQVVKEIFL